MTLFMSLGLYVAQETENKWHCTMNKIVKICNINKWESNLLKEVQGCLGVVAQQVVKN